MRVEVIPTPGKLPPVSVSGFNMVSVLAGLCKCEGTGDGKQLTPTYAEIVPKSCNQGY